MHLYKRIGYFYFLLAIFFFPNVLLGEEFIEEVNPYTDEASYSDSSEPKTQNNPSNAHWSFRLGLGGSLNSFIGSIVARYHYSDYVVPEIWATYTSINDDDFKSTYSTLETPITLVLANSTMFWPFAGAGPGFEKWNRSDQYGVIDDSYSLTAFHLLGIELKFSDFFSLVIKQKTIFYVNNQPVKEVINRNTPSEKIIHEEQIIKKILFNFYISF